MISVCLASYNGEKYIREQVDSILSQLGENDELVVSDDGSTDQTLEILNSYDDERIKIFHNSQNHGVNSNFENALENAKGDYIFLSDQDDVWLPGKVEACLKAMEKFECVVHDAIVVDGELNTTTESFFAERKSGPGFWKNLFKNTYVGCCMAFSKNVLNSSLPFPNSQYFYHDQWIGLISSLSFKTIFLSQPLIYFRRHGSNASSSSGKSKQNIKKKILSRQSITKALLLRYIILENK